jgi:hypothetical protein
VLMGKVGREREGPSGVIKCPLIGYGPKGEVVPEGSRYSHVGVLVSVEEDSLAGWATRFLQVYVTQNGQVVEWPQNRLN